jgi:alpha-beta hydrolase superfamily lysophospholipase
MTKMRRAVINSLAAGIVLAPLGAALAGGAVGGGILHPMRRELTPALIADAEQHFARVHAHREDFDVRAADGVQLRGWKVRPGQPTGDWVLLFHGVSDNRAGMSGHAEMLLRHGYSVVMMDARAHGASEGPMATYGWLERHDTQEIIRALLAKETPQCLFALGESMGASIALQSAGIEPRIEGVVAESAFRNLREVSYDYAGLRFSPLLGKTLFRPAAIAGISGAEKEGGFRAEDVSPENAVAGRPFPVLLICGLRDHNIPARHSKAIYRAATGPKELWLVPGAGHTQALGKAPQEFKRRVVEFLERIRAGKQQSDSSGSALPAAGTIRPLR